MLRGNNSIIQKRIGVNSPYAGHVIELEWGFSKGGVAERGGCVCVCGGGGGEEGRGGGEDGVLGGMGEGGGGGGSMGKRAELVFLGRSFVKSSR